MTQSYVKTFIAICQRWFEPFPIDRNEIFKRYLISIAVPFIEPFLGLAAWYGVSHLVEDRVATD